MLKRFVEAIPVVLDAATLIISTTVVFIPAARTRPMHVAVVVLMLLLAAETFWRMRRTGILKMTPRQVYASYDPRKPRATLLSAAAALMGTVAITVLSL